MQKLHAEPIVVSKAGGCPSNSVQAAKSNTRSSS